MKSHIGVIGMAVMGKNLALNLADQGYQVSIYNRTTAVTQQVKQENPKASLLLCETLESFVESLEKPRKILIMVQAGKAVDKVIEQLIPLIEQQDIIMDGGNSYFLDTINRYNQLQPLGFHFLGVGVSGGEEGARFGPALMPSGDNEAYQQVKPLFDAIAAKAFGEPCSDYVGKDGSGHFVKMVHNGIEYGDMQLIGETFDLLKRGCNYDYPKIKEVFSLWNKGRLNSYLIEITSQIMDKKDSHSNQYLLDVILDVARQKGTGKWTAEQSLSLNVDSSVLTAAVFGRFMSESKDLRVMASQLFTSEPTQSVSLPADFVDNLEKALYVSKLIAYAQGFDLLKRADKQYMWQLQLGNIAKGWRAGCIIRAAFLDKITQAYQQNPGLPHLLFDPEFAAIIKQDIHALRLVVKVAIDLGISVSGFINALAYFDAITNATSPANLIQAQRDFFGAHGFERVDQKGDFHGNW